MDWGRPITESVVNELGHLAIKALVGWELVNLPAIKDILA